MADTTSYDDVPYPSMATWYTHPAMLAQRALLLGMDPPRLAGCRVLELGCGPGGNLIPIAEQLPGARFVGVDLSTVHIDAGRALIQELGLPNIELRRASILELGPADGPFDYVLCHGVYSWVPPAVQEHILQLCKSLLTENGLAGVSYNCLPGWFLQGMLRNIMLRESRSIGDPEARLDTALDAMRVLADELEAVNTGRAEHLRSEIALFDEHARGYLFHEYLEDYNEPLYFYQFLERLERHGLTHLAELTPAGPRELPPLLGRGQLPESDAAFFARLQRVDILSDRRFRASVVCRASACPPRATHLDALYRLYAGCSLHSIEIEMNAGEPLKLSREGGPVHVTSPAAGKAVLAMAERWPRAEPARDLWEIGRSAAEEAGANDGAAYDETDFAQELCELYAAGIVDLYAARPRVQSAHAPFPRLRPLNAAEARRGRSLTSPWHHQITIADHERLMVPWLDGRPRSHLAARIAEALRCGELPPGDDPPEELAPRIADFVLTGMADCGMLVEPGPEGLLLEEWLD